MLRPLLFSLRSSRNTSSKDSSSGTGLPWLPVDGVGDGVACLCFLCFKDGVGEEGIPECFCFFREGVGEGGISGRFCFFKDGVGDGGGLGDELEVLRSDNNGVEGLDSSFGGSGLVVVEGDGDWDLEDLSDLMNVLRLLMRPPKKDVLGLGGSATEPVPLGAGDGE